MCRTLPPSMRSLIAPAVLCALIFALRIDSLRAQSTEGGVINREYGIKAAYLYQFAYYIVWPAGSFADNQSPFVIGILGSDPFGDSLNDIARNKKVDGRQIVIKQFNSLADYKPCHILFVSSSAEPVGNDLISIRKQQRFPVLLVGETPDFTEQGGAIKLFIEQNRIRFEVNMDVARRNQLKISSKLLSLAKIVDSEQDNKLY
jgi:hypothetical protein